MQEQQAIEEWRIPSAEMEEKFTTLLLRRNFPPDDAKVCAGIFTANSIDGIYSHGVNRFASFLALVDKGHIIPGKEMQLLRSAGAWEQWDAGLGPGPLNAQRATRRAMELADEFGVGCVGLSNSNHWMRGGTYGWQAAREGYAFMGWTNTIANMPAWGALDSRLGNNPLVLAVPYKEEAIVLDMAMTQYSYGAMELAKMKHQPLSVEAGFDDQGRLTRDPASILQTKRPLPIGYWKGAGLSLLLDILTLWLSGGSPVHAISARGEEYGLSQVFLAFAPSGPGTVWQEEIGKLIRDYQTAQPADPAQPLSYPGERVLKNRKENLARGIPVLRPVWEKILSL